jgi:hypothetical protein
MIQRACICSDGGVTPQPPTVGGNGGGNSGGNSASNGGGNIGNSGDNGGCNDDPCVWDVAALGVTRFPAGGTGASAAGVATPSVRAAGASIAGSMPGGVGGTRGSTSLEIGPGGGSGAAQTISEAGPQGGGTLAFAGANFPRGRKLQEECVDNSPPNYTCEQQKASSAGLMREGTEILDYASIDLCLAILLLSVVLILQSL